MEKPKVPTNPPPGSRFGGSVPSWRFPIWYFLLMVVILWVWQEVFNTTRVQTLPYSEFKARLAAREVTRVEINQDEILGEIVPKVGTNTSTQAVSSQARAPETGTAKPTNTADGSFARALERMLARTQSETSVVGRPFHFRTVRVEDPALVGELQEAQVQFAGVKPSLLAQLVLSWLLPIGVMIALWMYLGRKLGSAASGGLLSIGKSKARLIADNATGVTFDDVAGCDEAKFELQEVVDFLKNPNRYKSLGARIPKGALLIGPPGTGKTLLGRAVAGEAKVPFFSLSGSDFVEMFVGVGAARVRDLFQQAKSQAPCIVFIDELDAIGRQRGVHVGAVNDEREQTLNQLLVEMDGFEANVGVIVLAATNRPEVLDRALLRPGRFDRQILVDSPDSSGREAILRVHARNKPLDADVDLRRIAQATPGFSGADLANTINEAALLAARRKAETIAQRDLEDAIEKVIAGPERKGRRLSDEEKKRVACHEVGHALVAVHSRTADPIHKISIVPRGRAALGYTMQLPVEDQFLLTRTALLERIRGLLGGRAAEEIVFSEVTTGAENDLERATTLARQMVAMFGMSKRLGLVHCAQRPNTFLAGPSSAPEIDCSEETAREIDREVKEILDEAYAAAREVLTTHRDELELVTSQLLKDETLDAATFHRLIGLPPRDESAPRPRVPMPVPDIEVPAACGRASPV